MDIIDSQKQVDNSYAAYARHTLSNRQRSIYDMVAEKLDEQSRDYIGKKEIYEKDKKVFDEIEAEIDSILAEIKMELLE